MTKDFRISKKSESVRAIAKNIKIGDIFWKVAFLEDILKSKISAKRIK